MRIPGMLPPIAGVLSLRYPTDPFSFSRRSALRAVRKVRVMAHQRPSVFTALAVVGAVVVICAQAAPRAAQAPSRPVLSAGRTASAVGDDEQRAFLKQYCAACHSDRAK